MNKPHGPQTPSTLHDPSALQRHVLSTYLTLRIGIGLISLLFPFVLLGVGWYQGLPNPGSMSAYYWIEARAHAQSDARVPQAAASVDAARQAVVAAAASAAANAPSAGTQAPPPPRMGFAEPARTIFVSFLCAIAAVMYLYKGYTRAENIALNVAAVFAVGVVWFPMEVNCGQGSLQAPDFVYCFAGRPLPNPHGISAVLLFVCLFYIVWRRSLDTVDLIADPDVAARYRHIYRGTAILMAALPAAAGLMHVVANDFSTVTFSLEAAGVVAFSVFWLVKSYELHQTSADEAATRGAGLVDLTHGSAHSAPAGQSTASA